MIPTDKVQPPAGKKRQPIWLIYLSLLLGGVVLLGDAYHIARLDRWTIKLAIALIFAAFGLVVGNGRAAGFVSVGMVVAAVVLSFFF